jgi:hypothetical protein
VRSALALLLLVLPLAACGGTANLASLDPLQQAADKTTNVSGAHFQLSARIAALGQGMAVSGTGEIADHGQKLHMRLSVPNASAPLEAVAADGWFYVRGGPVDMFANGKWLRVKAGDRSFDLGQADPAKLLEYLRSSAAVERRGLATIRGVATTHYAARVRAGTNRVPLDVWVDGQGLVRRLRVDWQGADASIDLFDFGDVNVTVPAASDTVDLSNMLGGG